MERLKYVIFLISLVPAYGIWPFFLPKAYQSAKAERRVEDVGEPLFLTPFIESGDIEAAKEMAKVDTTSLMGLSSEIESYSGYITTNKETNGNLFFWFFPAESDPSSAPVVMWLDGGPGSSSMFSLFLVNGPFFTTVDENDVLTGVAENPYSWHKKVNIMYVDNPFGTGYSFGDKLLTTMDDITENLYDFLQQWYTMFPEYQGNAFFPFGHSFSGRYVPALTRKIHERNQEGGEHININLEGCGVGDGWMSPTHNAQYANFLYQVGLLDANQRDNCLIMETETRAMIELGQYYDAFVNWQTETAYFMGEIGCDYIYNIQRCPWIPAEEVYNEFCDLESTRLAVHVGNMTFHDGMDAQQALEPVIMEPGIQDVEYVLNNGIRMLMYDGNMDIIVTHTGVLDMMTEIDWVGREEYEKAVRSIYTEKGSGDVIGYLTSADNLRLLLVRNAGHEVPLYQPVGALQMMDEFTRNVL